jgi:uncharacterized cupredoxin-like copper-binding protein
VSWIRRYPIGRVGIVAASVALALGGCGDSGPTSAPSPAPSGARTIEIEAQDALRFDPSELTVTAGETIYFIVSNTGGSDHEFILGDAGVQTAHAEDGGHGAHGSDETLASLDLPPGATETATVTFEEPGTILFGCHIDGHYSAGMVGTITVEG